MDVDSTEKIIPSTNMKNKHREISETEKNRLVDYSIIDETSIFHSDDDLNNVSDVELTSNFGKRQETRQKKPNHDEAC